MQGMFARLMYTFAIPLGRDRVICPMVGSPVEQLCSDNTVSYFNAFSELRVHSECDRGLETLLYRKDRFVSTY